MVNRWQMFKEVISMIRNFGKKDIEVIQTQIKRQKLLQEELANSDKAFRKEVLELVDRLSFRVEDLVKVQQRKEKDLEEQVEQIFNERPDLVSRVREDLHKNMSHEELFKIMFNQSQKQDNVEDKIQEGIQKGGKELFELFMQDAKQLSAKYQQESQKDAELADEANNMISKLRSPPK